MAAKEVAENKIICSEGQAFDAIHIIATGSVKAHFSGGDIILRKGDVVGLADIAYDSHFFTYTTLEASSFLSFPVKDKKSLAAIIKTNPEVCKMVYTSMISQTVQIMEIYTSSLAKCSEIYNLIHTYYENYQDLCSHNNVISRSLPDLDELKPLELEEEVTEWITSYYLCMKDFPQDLKHNLASRIPYLNGFLLKASQDIHSAFSGCTAMADYLDEAFCFFMRDSGLDFFDLYTALLFRLKQGTPDADTVVKTVDSIIKLIESGTSVPTSLIKSRVTEYRQKLANLTNTSAAAQESEEKVSNQDLANALDIILEYADMNDEFAGNFKALVGKYKKVPDKGSSDDSVRKLRLEITKGFYEIYAEAFQASVKDYDLPPVMKMFFNFGFMDAELSGIENANFLYSIANDFRGNEDLGVFTAYEWLMAIYNMRKEPSRNEFDTDYLSYLHEQKVQGKIDAEQEKRLTKDPGQRVMFELNNMFPMVNKVTFGRLSTFCPILCEGDIIKPLQSCLVTVDTITETFKKLEAIDYGAFYRETIYTNDSCGIQKEFIQVRIAPDVILFPNVGTRGVMWQEIEGKKRNTPARFMVSVFHMEDILNTLTRLTGEYRWEMCKRMQGARWNDVTEPSLTSEYFDYVQFYKKNSELSSDAKEKIKTSLTKAKNSFKEMFVRDYLTWVLFEGAGSPRLNKVARAILLTYCPFPQELRQKISANPMFKELIERYDIKTGQKLHHLDNVITKLKSSGQEVPPEILIHRQFLEGTVKN